MKVLFLDFDGVLNSIQHYLATKDIKVRGATTLNDADLWAMKRDVNANNMWALGYILEKVPDLKIVISSAWRLHYDIESFKELFEIFKLDGSRIIGKTPKKLSSERCHEIVMWLDDNDYETGEVVDFMTIDDHIIFDIEHPYKPRELQTDPWVGMTMHDAFKIIKHFKPDFNEPIVYI